MFADVPTSHSPRLFLIGSPVTSSTLIMAMGYTAGTILDMNPIAPVLLSTFTVPKKDVFKINFSVITIRQIFVMIKLFQNVVTKCWVNILTDVCIAFRRAIELDDPLDVETFDKICPNLGMINFLINIYCCLGRVVEGFRFEVVHLKSVLSNKYAFSTLQTHNIHTADLIPLPYTVRTICCVSVGDGWVAKMYRHISPM